MSRTRLELHEEFKHLLGSDHVYYQPPESLEMTYPAIVYSLDNINNNYADNDVYRQFKLYRVIVISKKPDHPVVDKLSVYPYCGYVRAYNSDNLHHTVFNLFW